MAEPERVMESGCSLACVIQQLQDEIRKLAMENKELRGQLSLPLTDTSPTDSEQRDGTPENHTNLRRNVSAPVLEGQYKGKILQCTVRESRKVIFLKSICTSYYLVCAI